MRNLILSVILVLPMLVGCFEECGDEGCITCCCDGNCSDSTGRGTCSSHDGVCDNEDSQTSNLETASLNVY